MSALREHSYRGLHLGWIPNDPGMRLREFAGPAPQAPAPDSGKVRALRAAHAFRSGWIRLLIAVGAFALALFGLVGSVSHRGWFWDIAMVVTAGCWLPAGYFGWAHRRAVNGVRRDDEERARRHAADVAEYEERKAHWDKAEAERIARAPRWLRVTADEDISRLDVFGGTARGRRNMLAGLGWSLLEQRAVIVLDLSQDRVCDGLIAAAGQAGIPCQDYQLPRDLRATPLLAGLSGDQIASQIVEVMHADDPRVTTAGRATDLMVLNKIHRALGDDVSMARLYAALCFLLTDAPEAPDAPGVPGVPGVPDGRYLTTEERASLGGLFSGFRQEVTSNLVRLAAVIEPLRELGTDVEPRPPARLTCLSLEDGPRDVAADLTAALIVQWATQSIVSGGGFRPAVVLAGADEQATRHLGRLTTVCERYQVPLVRIFSRLTEESARHLDSRNTAFMRLPTRPEALRAAEHIGLERRFVAGHFSHSHSVSRSRTRSMTESVTHTTGYTEGEAATRTTGTTTGESVSETEIPRRDHPAPGNRQPSGDGQAAGQNESGKGQTGKREASEKPRAKSGRVEKDIIKTRTRFKAEHESQSKTQSWSRSEETSHTTSESRSRTDGTSVGDEITYDLAYDHKVQPETLMELPDDRMLAPHIVEGSAGPGKSLADSRMVALVIDPSVIGSDAVAPVGPDEIPAYEAPPPLVSSHVPDYARLPAP